MSRDAFQAEIERLTAGIAALRIVHGLIRKGNPMTIEIKGLGANVEAARAAIRRARVATARMNESGGTLERTANEIASVFEQHTVDLMREATELGNGSPEPETPSQQGAQGVMPTGGQAAQAGSLPGHANDTPRKFGP